MHHLETLKSVMQGRMSLGMYKNVQENSKIPKNDINRQRTIIRHGIYSTTSVFYHYISIYILETVL